MVALPVVYTTVVVSLDATVVNAQVSKPAFEVVSIRRSVAAGPEVTRTQGDTYRATATSIHRQVLYAYEMREDQLSGGPNWIRTERFDIVAKPAGATLRETRLMVRTLLADKFGLVLEVEQREADVYALKVARANGRLGPDLRRVSDDCVDRRFDPIEAARTALRPSSGVRPSSGAMCATLADLAERLSGMLNTSVVDATGLPGRWDYVLAHSGIAPASQSDRDDRPNLFTAVEEQLGLKLERARGLNKVWIVKSIHPPIEN
jgi:uncharacterized protein (TIGR03435 family)